MRLIAGLGNPGKKYINTRHNIGFRVIDELAKRFNIKLKKKLFGSARQGQSDISDESIILIQPLTFMNLSGGCVAHYVHKYNIPHGNILIVCDDINLSLGQFRLRAQGASGGHHGLESIIRTLKTEVFARLRIGVKAEGGVDDFKEFLLSDFKEEELPKAEESIHLAADACFCWAREGIDKAMSIYNVHND